MKKIIGFMLTIFVGMIFLTGCTEQTVKNEEVAPKADRLAKITMKAILDEDYKTIYNKSDKTYRESMTDELRGDPAFMGDTEEEIQQKEILSPGIYKKLVADGDYIFGAYYGFLKDKNVVLYYVNGYFEGMRKTRLFELQKVKDTWKIIRYSDWRTSTVKDQKDKYINLIEKGESKDVQVFHRGENY